VLNRAYFVGSPSSEVAKTGSCKKITKFVGHSMNIRVLLTTAYSLLLFFTVAMSIADIRTHVSTIFYSSNGRADISMPIAIVLLLV
jgi:hypothetical protein